MALGKRQDLHSFVFLLYGYLNLTDKHGRPPGGWLWPDLNHKILLHQGPFTNHVYSNLGRELPKSPGQSLVRIFYTSDTSSEACQMNGHRILLLNLLNRHQRFDFDASRLTLKDTDQSQSFHIYHPIICRGSCIGCSHIGQISLFVLVDGYI